MFTTVGTLMLTLIVGIWATITAVKGLSDLYRENRPKAISAPEPNVIGTTDEIGSIDK